jgi:GNAT superfamily N-acetyltransferase
MRVHHNAPMGDWAIRAGTAEDGIAVAELFARSRRAAMPWLPVLHSPEEDAAFFTAQVAEQQAWLAVGEAIRGFAVVGDGWLHHLYVDPDHQGRGVGTALLGVAVDAGARRLWAFQRNTAARAFYEARGFVEVERTDGSGNEEREPDVLMALRSDPAG